VTTKAQKIARLKSKEYRDAFVASQISVGLPFQIRALREQRGWKQSRLAGEAGMLQPRISAMERPGESKFNLETLRRIASAFDVALEVRFVPFSELLDWSERFDPDNFKVPEFEDDAALDLQESASDTTLQQLARLTAGNAPEWYERLDLAKKSLGLGQKYPDAFASLQQLAMASRIGKTSQVEATRVPEPISNSTLNDPMLISGQTTGIRAEPIIGASLSKHDLVISISEGHTHRRRKKQQPERSVRRSSTTAARAIGSR
jgi:transcriptional regulator with XRE-family HTH domain